MRRSTTPALVQAFGRHILSLAAAATMGSSVGLRRAMKHALVTTHGTLTSLFMLQLALSDFDYLYALRRHRCELAKSVRPGRGCITPATLAIKQSALATVTRHEAVCRAKRTFAHPTCLCAPPRSTPQLSNRLMRCKLEIKLLMCRTVYGA